MKQTLLYLFILLQLYACNDTSSQKEMQLSSTRVHIDVSSYSRIKAGITGAPHVPLIIPLIDYERSSGVFISIGDHSSIAPESFDDLLSQKEADKILSSIDIKASPDEKHFVYTRKDDNTDTVVFLHVLDTANVFLSTRYSKAYSDGSFDWNKVLSPAALAVLMIRDTTYHDPHESSLWLALTINPNKQFDDVALDMCGIKKDADDYVYSRYSQADEKWQQKVKKKIAMQLDGLKVPGRKSSSKQFERYKERLQFMDLMTGAINDSALSDKLTHHLAENFLKDQFIMSMLKDKVGLEMYEQALSERDKRIVNSKIDTFLHIPVMTPMTADMLQLCSSIKDSVRLEKGMRVVLSQWPAAEGSDDLLYQYFESCSEEFRKQALIKAEKSLDKKKYNDAEGLLGSKADCETIKRLVKEYPDKFKNRSECFPQAAKKEQQ
jgi:hypothetical protein